MFPKIRKLLGTDGLQRFGLIPFLFMALALVTLLFVGCLRLMEWNRPRDVARAKSASGVNVERDISVRLMGREPRRDVQIAVTSAFSISDARSDRPVYQSDVPIGLSIVAPFRKNGISIGHRTIDSNDVIVTPVRDASIVVAKPTRRGKVPHTYRGRLRIERRGDGLCFTNLVDVESYLYGVLRGELPRSFHSEAFKTQAVAARTYVLYQKRIASPGRTFDVLDHEGSQMYIGVRGEDRIAVRAVDGTRGEVCLWHDNEDLELFCTYYSSTCGGLSQPVNYFRGGERNIPPLSGNVRCTDCYVSPYYRWKSVRVSKADVTRRIVANYPSVKRIGRITRLEPKAKTSDGRVIRIKLVGSGGLNETLMGEDFRLSVGSRVLKSTNFMIADDGDHFVFSNGRGFGHGVGLCQYGMETKAARGMSYVDILAAYYPGSLVRRVYD